MSGLPHWLSCLPPSQQLEAGLPPGQPYSWCHTGCWVFLPKNQRGLPLADIQFSNTQTVKGQQPTAAECGGFQGEVKGKKAQRLLRDPALTTDEGCRRQQGPEESPPKWGDFVNRGRAGNGWPCWEETANLREVWLLLASSPLARDCHCRPTCPFVRAISLPTTTLTANPGE